MRIFTLLFFVGYIGFLHAQNNEAKESKDLQKAIKKHQNWDKAVILLDNGDTLNGKIKPNSVTGGNHWRYSPVSTIYALIPQYPYTKYYEAVLFAEPNGKEDTLNKRVIKEIFVYGLPDSLFHFVAVDYDTGKALAYVLKEGIAKFVTIAQLRGMISGAISYGDQNDAWLHANDVLLNTNPVWRKGGSNSEQSLFYDDYQLYYKDKLYGVEPDAFIKKKRDPAILKLYQTMFADCPALVEKISQPNYRQDDFRLIVEEFNNCIGTKK